MVLLTPLACSFLEKSDVQGNAKGLSSAMTFPQVARAISRQYKEPTFEPITNGKAIRGIIVSCAVMAITLLSFKLVRRAEE